MSHDSEITVLDSEKYPAAGAGDMKGTYWIFPWLRDTWRRLLVATAIGFVAFALIAFLIPVRYEAVARLMPPDQVNSGGALMGALMASGGGFLADLGSSALGMHTTGATIVGVLNSRTVQDDIINQFGLKQVYGLKRQEDARKALRGRSSISEDRRSGIITIAVEDHDPQRASKMAQAYVNDLNGRIANLTASAAHRERVFLEERLAKVKEQLDEATLRLSQFSSKNKTLDPQLQGKAMLDAASALQGQLIAAETELSGLQQIYGPENYRVKAVSSKVGELRAKLRNMSGSQTGGSAGDGQLYPSLEQLPLLGNTYYELARQAKVNEAIYEVLIKQYELAKVEEAKELPSIKVLDEPVVPERKSFPPRLLIAIGGAILTFVCAAAWLFAQEIWRRLDEDDPLKIGVREFAASLPRRSKAAARGATA